MPTDLIMVGGGLVLVVGVLIFMVIRRQKSQEPPHFG